MKASRWWLFVLLLASPVASAELRALLVGVSTYPHLSAEWQLQGPRNDVPRLRDALLSRGFKPGAITLLADQVAGAQLPTRAGILRELARQVELAAPDDIVFLYLGGHGSQQPMAKADIWEPDGAYEVFLPRDAVAGKAEFDNVILDREIRAHVDQMLDKGAFVFVAVDSCHAATMVRSDYRAMVRHVPRAAVMRSHASWQPGTVTGPATLGQDREPPPISRRQRHGKAVYLYAVQSSEQAVERELVDTDGEPLDRGVFSYFLARGLRTPHPITYRQLAEHIQRSYATIPTLRASPYYTGNGLDAALFGQGQAGVRGWAVLPDLRIATGSLSGIAAGTLFKLASSALSAENDLIGYARAAQVEPNSTRLEPVAHNGLPAARQSLLTGSQARLLRPDPDFSLKLAVDNRACGARCPWEAVVERLKEEGVAGVNLQWVETGADLVLQFKPEGVLLGDVHGTATRRVELASRKPGMRKSAMATQLQLSLHRIARATNLQRIAAELALQPRDTRLQVDVVARRKGVAPVRLTEGAAYSLRAGDEVDVSVHHRSDFGTLDLTVLYLDSHYGINVLYPLPGASNRLEPKAQIDEGEIVAEINTQTTGRERLILIAVPMQRDTEPADFSFLQQDAVVLHRRDWIPAPLRAFWDAAYASGLQRHPPTDGTHMYVYELDIQPD